MELLQKIRDSAAAAERSKIAHLKEIEAVQVQLEKARKIASAAEQLQTEHDSQTQTLKVEIEAQRLMAVTAEKARNDQMIQFTSLREQLAQLTDSQSKEKADKVNVEALRAQHAKAQSDHVKETMALRAEVEAQRLLASTAEKARNDQIGDFTTLRNQLKEVMESQSEDKNDKDSLEVLRTQHAKDIEASNLEIQKSLKAQHAKEIERVKSELEKFLKSQHAEESDTTKSELEKRLKSQHAKEVASLKSEIETLKNRSNKLGGVESKIADVEAALQASKSAASENEQHLVAELRTKDEDKDQLVKVIEALKDEIDHAQKQLDADNKLQRLSLIHI